MSVKKTAFKGCSFGAEIVVGDANARQAFVKSRHHVYISLPRFSTSVQQCIKHMALFTVRIELHDAYERDYDQLHAAMAQVGFSRIITADNGVKYHMPFAEYNYTANLDSAGVLRSAKQAANTTGKQFAVLVNECSSRRWEGLVPVR